MVAGRTPGRPVVVTGTVLEVLPRALYAVAIEGGRRVTAHAVTGAQKTFVRLVVGDRVDVALTPRDLSRGRILRRSK